MQYHYVNYIYEILTLFNKSINIKKSDILYLSVYGHMF